MLRLINDVGMPISGSGSGLRAVSAPCLASASAFSLPGISECPGTQVRLTRLTFERFSSDSQHLNVSAELIFGEVTAP